MQEYKINVIKDGVLSEAQRFIEQEGEMESRCDTHLFSDII